MRPTGKYEFCKATNSADRSRFPEKIDRSQNFPPDRYNFHFSLEIIQAPPLLFPVSIRTLWGMTRPGFLAATVVACALGIAAATAVSGVAVDPWRAVATLLLAAIAHASANVINDFYDDRNGADASNTGRIFPFTGGARFIQQRRVSARDTHRYALLLLALTIAGGCGLALASGPGLFAIGAAGLALGWCYSAPPLQLMSRGLGEVAVAFAWSLIVVGAAYVQSGQFNAQVALCSLSYGLMAANILIVNGFPDAASDALVGKHTLVVRLGPTRAALAYAALALTAHVGLAALALLSAVPTAAVWGLLSLPFSLTATVILWGERETPHQLRPAIKLTITAALLHGAAQATGLLLMRSGAF